MNLKILNMDLNSPQLNARNKNKSNAMGLTSGQTGFPRKQRHLKSMGGGIMYPRTMYAQGNNHHQSNLPIKPGIQQHKSHVQAIKLGSGFVSHKTTYYPAQNGGVKGNRISVRGNKTNGFCSINNYSFSYHETTTLSR